MRAAVKPSHTQNAVVNASCKKLWSKNWLDRYVTCASTYAAIRLTIAVMIIGIAALEFFFMSTFAHFAHISPNNGFAYQILPTTIELTIASATAHMLIST